MTTNTVDYVVAAADGRILRWGTCPPDMLAVQAGDGEHAVQGRGRPDTHCVRDGTLCTFTPAQRQRLAHRPGPWAVWSLAAMDWHDPRTASEALDDAKASAWADVKAARAAAINGPITTPWGRFDADPASRAAIAEALSLRRLQGDLQGDEGVTWTTADNQAVSLTWAQLADVAQRIARRTQQAHDGARRLREQIDQAQDLAAVHACRASAAENPPFKAGDHCGTQHRS